ncbi:MAG: hypothetical protein H7833_21105 [Magnetococcus sp. DMHC-1]
MRNAKKNKKKRGFEGFIPQGFVFFAQGVSYSGSLDVGKSGSFFSSRFFEKIHIAKEDAVWQR